MGPDSQPYGLAYRMVCDEQMAGKFCLSDRLVLVDVRFGSRLSRDHFIDHREFSDGQSRPQKPHRIPPI